MDTPPEPSVSFAGLAAHTFMGASRDFHLDIDGLAASGSVLRAEIAPVHAVTVTSFFWRLHSFVGSV